MDSGVPIHEMERMAQTMPPPQVSFDISNDIGNVINLDMNDDLGLGMLANPNKVSQPSSSGNSGGSAPPPLSQQPSTNFNLAPLEAVNLDSSFPMMSSSTLDVRRENTGDVGFGGGGGGLFGNAQSATGPTMSLPATRDPEKEKAEKNELINKLRRLEARGFQLSKHFTLDNSLDEIKQEFMRLMDARNLEGALKFQRQMLMGLVTGVEWLNTKYDPFDVKLEGWSESVHENVEDFDEIFEDLYDKYKDRGKMPPEMRLMMSLVGSGFMCHVSNTYFRSKAPSMDDVLKKNPQLARQMAAAVANEAGPGFGNMMGMAMGATGPQPQSNGPQQQQAFPMGPSAAGPFFQSSRVPNLPQPLASVEQPRATARREMKGPSGVDDILKTFEEVRRAELEEVRDAPPPQMQQTPQSAIAAMELQSLHSEEIHSQADTTRSSGGRRRRRQATVPEGNTISLNV